MAKSTDGTNKQQIPTHLVPELEPRSRPLATLRIETPPKLKSVDPAYGCVDWFEYGEPSTGHSAAAKLRLGSH